MRILFLSTEFPTPNDQQRAIFNLRMCEVLSRRHDVRVVAPTPWTQTWKRGPQGIKVAHTLHSWHPRYYFIPRFLASLRGSFMWWSLRRTLQTLTANWRPDVILTYWTFPDGEVALRLGRHLDVPVVQIVGGSDVLMSRRAGARWRRTERVLQSVDAVVTIGRHLAQQVVQLGIAADKVHSLYRPVSHRLFSPGSREEARKRLGLPGTGSIAVFVGRFVEVKGLTILVDSLGLLQRAGLCLLVCLLGDGPQLPEIRSRVDAQGLNGMVRLAGPVPNEQLVHWYRAADFTVLPSLSEGVPNVLLESIACGVPFVASAVGGIPEIADLRLDELATVGSPESLAAALTAQMLRQSNQMERAFVPPTEQDFGDQLEAVLAKAVAARTSVERAQC